MADEMSMKEWYHEVYLKSDYWKMRRLQIMDARGYKCELCGSTNRLEIHHSSYDHLGEEYDNELFCLCRDCHQLIHNLIEKRKGNAADRERDEAVAKAVSKAVNPMRADFIEKDVELLTSAYFKINNTEENRSHLLSVINHASGQITPKWMRGDRVEIYAPSTGLSYVHQRALQVISKKIKKGESK